MEISSLQEILEAVDFLSWSVWLVVPNQKLAKSIQQTAWRKNYAFSVIFEIEKQKILQISNWQSWSFNLASIWSIRVPRSFLSSSMLILISLSWFCMFLLYFFLFLKKCVLRVIFYSFEWAHQLKFCIPYWYISRRWTCSSRVSSGDYAGKMRGATEFFIFSSTLTLFHFYLNSSVCPVSIEVFRS